MKVSNQLLGFYLSSKKLYLIIHAMLSLRGMIVLVIRTIWFLCQNTALFLSKQQKSWAILNLCVHMSEFWQIFLFCANHMLDIWMWILIQSCFKRYKCWWKIGSVHLIKVSRLSKIFQTSNFDYVLDTIRILSR